MGNIIVIIVFMLIGVVLFFKVIKVLINILTS